jgi:hypothetical protein
LYQLMPVLQQLDPSRAESLLREDREVRRLVSDNPGGVKLEDSNQDSSGGDESPNTLHGFSLNSEDSPPDPLSTAMLDASMQWESDVEKVMREAENNPDKAFQDAMKLQAPAPGARSPSPRMMVLPYVAVAAARKQDAKVAKAAMDELLHSADQADIGRQAQLLRKIPETYISLHDYDSARESIKTLMALAAKLNERDLDSSDPSLASKAFWPSTGLWSVCIEDAYKISPALAEQTLAAVTDPDIAALQHAEYGSLLTGASRLPLPTFRPRKTDSSR